MKLFGIQDQLQNSDLLQLPYANPLGKLLIESLTDSYCCCCCSSCSRESLQRKSQIDCGNSFCNSHRIQLLPSLQSPVATTNSYQTGTMMVAKQRNHHFPPPFTPSVLACKNYEKKATVQSHPVTVYKQKGLRLGRTLKLNFNINLVDKTFPDEISSGYRNASSLHKTQEMKGTTSSEPSKNTLSHRESLAEMNNTLSSTHLPRQKTQDMVKTLPGTRSSRSSVLNPRDKTTNNDTLPSSGTSTSKQYTTKHIHGNNISNKNNTSTNNHTDNDDDKLQIKLSMDLNVRKHRILKHFKTLNLNLRLVVNDRRRFKESLSTVVVKHKVDYHFWEQS